MMDNPSHGSIELVVEGALALAAHFFPREHEGTPCIRVDDAYFLLSGQVDVWSRWPALDRADKVRIARLLRFRPVEVANRTVLFRRVEELVPRRISGFRPLDRGRLLVDLGRPPLDRVDECLALLDAERQAMPRRTPATATQGTFATTLRTIGRSGETSRAFDVHYRLDLADEQRPEPPTPLSPPADADHVDIPVSELRDIAVRLDTASDQKHRLRAVNDLFENAHVDEGGRIGDVWSLRAGPTQVFQAPTGSGKNVVAELVACWCALHGRVASLVLPTNTMVLKTARSVERSLGTLGSEAGVVPLTSPNSAQQVAEATAATTAGDDDLGTWAMDRLAYGCALIAAASTKSPVDTWVPGDEPCVSLRKIGGDGRPSGARHACAWKETCGKYRNVRQACSAAVVVTSHLNWLVGRLHVPVLAQGRVEQDMRVEELLLHRSDVVLIDEIDAFQAAMISRSATGLILATRRPMATPPPPLRRLDAEFQDAAGRLDGSIEAQVRAAIAQARYLAENYTGHLSDGAFARRPRRGTGSPVGRDRWLLPRKWDAWLAATLFGVPDGQQPRSADYQALRDLFADDVDDATVPDWLRPVRTALIRVTSLTTGEDAFKPAWHRIFEALGHCPYNVNRLADDEDRARVTDRLIQRAYLDQLRTLLLSFVYAAPQLRASGVMAAREVADGLRQYAVWHAAPYGPLGRSLFAFAEHYDADRPDDTTLRVGAFGGDPHGYVISMGDVTALAHLGRPRVVVGLSATSYFPGAPHHHVLSRPRWWVSDDHTGSFRIRVAAVSDEEREFVRVSGTHGSARAQVLTKLGSLLWKKRLAPALQQLAADPLNAHRQRLLLATTSYQGAEDLATGIADAGVEAHRIVLAVRADDSRSGTTRWVELPADRLESFGHEVDGSILIAPLARAQRGLNIVDRDGRSLIGSAWLVVRPVPVIDEPAEILAHVHARARAATTPTDDPAGALELIRHVAGRNFEELFGSLPYFTTLPQETRLGIVAETLNGLIQLAGRARRGGATGEIHLVDYAFLDPRGRSDLPRLITRLRLDWQRAASDFVPLDLMYRLYGRTLDEIFAFADSQEDTDADD